MIQRVVVVFLACLIAPLAFAEREPAPGPSDARVKTVVYNPRDVVHLNGHYGYQTLIRFADDEHIENLSIGDSLAWQIVPNERGNLLFVKPVEDNATTNLTVVTARPSTTNGLSQRVYLFELSAREVPREAGSLTWSVQFQYPDDDIALLLQPARAREPEISPIDTADPTDWNFNYSFAGHISQVPVKLFDNGVFTYFEFDALTDTPAIFLVDSEQNESLVNGVRQGKYVVVHRVGRQFTLRNGSTVTCIFNDAFPAPTLDAGSPAPRDESKSTES